MKVINVVMLNEMRFKTFFAFIVSLQFAMIGLVLLTNLQMFKFMIILRVLICVINLIFIPGIIILRILKINNIETSKVVLYSVGLSISALILLGILLNILGSLFDVRLISFNPLFISYCFLIMVMLIYCYKNDNNYSKISLIETKNYFSNIALFLYIIPFMCIFGTYISNEYNINILLIIMFISMCYIVLINGTSKAIPEELYVVIIFIFSISLLWHNSLISNYIWGWDINQEYYLANKVIENSMWDYTIPSNVNGMLSITMLAPIISFFTGLTLTWTLKIVYPLIYSFVSLGIYELLKKQTCDKRVAFYSVLFFIFLFVFYADMLQLARQQIAELYMILFFLVVFDNKIGIIAKKILMIIYVFSLIVSHYGLAYIFIITIVTYYLTLHLYKLLKPKGNIEINIQHKFIILIVTLALSWYMFLTSSSSFITIVTLGNHVISSLSSTLFSSETSQPLSLILTKSDTWLHATSKYIHISTQFCITYGIICTLIRRNRIRINLEYTLLSLQYYLLLILGIIIPHLASALNTNRLYHISLLILSPFFIIGSFTLFYDIFHQLNKEVIYNDIRIYYKILSIYLVIFFLFNNGLIYEICNDNPTSISLNTTLDYPVFNEKEDTAAKWIEDQKNTEIKEYADGYRYLLLWRYSGENRGYRENNDQKMWFPDKFYFLMGSRNIMSNKLVIISQYSTFKSVDIEDTTLYSSLCNMSDIYNNGGSKIYLTT